MANGGGIDPDTLEFGPEVPLASISHGLAYAAERRVTLVEFSPLFCAARVRGRRIYDVELEWDGGALHPYCTCPYFEAAGAVCKHIVATVVEFAAALGLPPVARGRARRRGLEPPMPGSEEWRSRIVRVAARVPPAPPASFREEPETRFFALLDLQGRSWLSPDILCFLLRYRTRLRSGGWSVPKHFPLDSASPNLPRPPREVEELFERVRVASLVGRHGASSSHEFNVGLGRAAPILRDLASRGALECLLPGGAVEALPLDPGGPFEAVLSVRKERESAIVEARFERGDDRIGLREVAAVLPGGLLLAKGRLFEAEFRGALGWIEELRDRGEIEAPAGAFGDLVRAVVEGPGDPALRIEGVEAAPAPEPQPKLHLSFGDGTGPVACALRFAYGNLEAEALEPRARILDPKGTVFVPRRPADEARFVRRLREAGLDGMPHRREGIVGFLPRLDAPDVAMTLLGEGWHVAADGKAWRPPGTFRLSVSTGIDWFDLTGGATFGDQTVDLPELLRALREGRRQVVLADGSVGMVPAEAERRLRLLASLGAEEGQALRFRAAQGLLLDALLEERGDVDVDAAFAGWRRRLASFEGCADIAEPRTLRGSLRPYQRRALGWFDALAKLGLGGCLADDMGLGKTIMVLAWLLRRGGGPSLVVAPKSLVWNWAEEARRFAPDLDVVEYAGPDRRRRFDAIARANLVVTTYGVLRVDAPKLREIEFDYAILDEAQSVKNPGSLAAKAARLLRARHRLALTGTPVENHLGDLWSLMEFLNPGLLGGRRVHDAWARGGSIDAEERGRLARALRPVLLRRTKQQVLEDLPGRTETTVHCEMEAPQRRAYDELANYYRERLLGAEAPKGGRERMVVLEALLRLRQAACHPGLLDDARRNEASAKFDALLPMLEELRDAGHKALVFSQFTSLLALLRERLDAGGWRYAYLDGGTRDRKSVVGRFQADPEETLFLISLKAGGAGLNLTAASYIFLLDPWWNPAVEAQAIDRAHRIGQERPVTAYRLVCKGTVEERILELQEKKRALADAVIRADGSLLRSLSREDLELLLGRGAAG